MSTSEPDPLERNISRLVARWLDPGPGPILDRERRQFLSMVESSPCGTRTRGRLLVVALTSVAAAIGLFGITWWATLRHRDGGGTGDPTSFRGSSQGTNREWAFREIPASAPGGRLRGPYERVTTALDWEWTWQEVGKERPLPLVDFGKEMVLVARGKIHRILETNEGLQIHFSRAPKSLPGLAVLPRSDRRLEFVEALDAVELGAKPTVVRAVLDAAANPPSLRVDDDLPQLWVPLEMRQVIFRILEEEGVSTKEIPWLREYLSATAANISFNITTSGPGRAPKVEQPSVVFEGFQKAASDSWSIEHRLVGLETEEVAGGYRFKFAQETFIRPPGRKDALHFEFRCEATKQFMEGTPPGPLESTFRIRGQFVGPRRLRSR